MNSAISVHDLSKLDAAGRAALLKRSEADLGPFLEKVRPIIEAVRQEGDAALSRFAREFDKAPVAADDIRVSEAEFDGALARMEPEVVTSIEFAAASIRKYHEEQMPEAMWLSEVRPGAFAGERHLPIPSVACYVPRGKGAFPSVAMMTTIPAMVAGVPEVAIVTPPGPDGRADAATLVVAKLAAVRTVYKCGGAQGVAAVAYGTETVRRCAKIVGPGSPYVVAAKRLLADVIDPGIPAGPSEAIVLADDTADGRIAGLDLLIEAEHGPDSSAFLVTPSRRVAEEAMAAIPGYWAEMSDQRVRFSRTVLTGPHGGIVLTRDLREAFDFVNDFAPEHLEVLAVEPMGLLGSILNAGEILLGRHTPISIGNFVLGANCVLPTNAAARTVSPLSVFDFLKRSSVGYVTAAGYAELARHTRVLATYEGFDAHALAVSGVRDKLLKHKGK